MKKLLFVSFMVSIALLPVLAQKKMDLSKLYLQAGAGGSTSSTNNWGSVQLGLRTVFNNKWTFTASAMHMERDAHAPKDYVGTSGSGWFGSYTDLHPKASSDFFYFSAGRFFPLSRSIYFTVDAGLGMAKGQQFSYIYSNGTYNSSYDYSYSPNYAVKSTDKTAFGGIIRTGFDWAFSGIVGIGIDAFYNYNTDGINDNLGFNVKLIIGWMNRGPKKK